MTIEVGREAPDFALRDQHGQTVRLTSYRGERTVALMFYPFAFSRVCSGELAAVRDHLADLQTADVQLLAVSCDPMFTLRAFAERDGLTFPLLSDFWPHGAVSSAYGAFDAERGCARRSTVVVDRDGVVRWTVDNAMAEAREVRELTAVLADIRREADTTR